MGSGFAKKKKEARLFQQKMSEMQETLKKSLATGSAGNGLVEITLNGDHEMVKISIKPECVDKEDIEGLEDLIKAAYLDASKKLEEALPDMPKNMSGLNSLAGFDF